MINVSTSIEKTKEGDDNGVLTFIYHKAIEEVECGNCHAKVGIYNLSSMECITDCTQHKDHECDLKLGYVRLKFSSCGDMCSECQSVILYQTCLKQTTPPKETIESSSDDESEGYGYDTDSLTRPTPTTTTKKKAIGTRIGTGIRPVDGADQRVTVPTTAVASNRIKVH